MLKDYSEKFISVANNDGNVYLQYGNFFRVTITGTYSPNFIRTDSRAAYNTGVFSFSMLIKQDGAGGKSINWNNNNYTIYWPGGTTPQHTTTANKGDLWTFFTEDGGNTYYGVISLYDIAGI